jgi:hypothetical protein
MGCRYCEVSKRPTATAHTCLLPDPLGACVQNTKLVCLFHITLGTKDGRDFAMPPRQRKPRPVEKQEELQVVQPVHEVAPPRQERVLEEVDTLPPIWVPPQVGIDCSLCDGLTS